MNVGDLIEELRKFPELSTVFIQQDTSGIQHLDSAHAIWVKSVDGSGLHGPFTEVQENAEDFGVLLYG